MAPTDTIYGWYAELVHPEQGAVRQLVAFPDIVFARQITKVNPRKRWVPYRLSSTLTTGDVTPIETRIEKASTWFTEVLRTYERGGYRVQADFGVELLLSEYEDSLSRDAKVEFPKQVALRVQRTKDALGIETFA
jgi:hypothetical protein